MAEGEEEQFSLCWNNYNTNLSTGFHESLLRGDLVDVTIAADGQLVKAHRLVLSVCSPFFQQMFTNMPANQHAFGKFNFYFFEFFDFLKQFSLESTEIKYNRTINNIKELLFCFI